MEAQRLVVGAGAALEGDVVADLEAEPVPVPVAGGDVLEVDAVRVLQEHRAAVVAVLRRAHHLLKMQQLEVRPGRAVGAAGKQHVITAETTLHVLM